MQFRSPNTPKCPSCLRAVYAAEQVLGPAATAYHKSCLRCQDCQKTVASHQVFEHGTAPYCKACHARNFGTRGVGYGNALAAEYAPRSPTLSSPASTPLHTPLRHSDQDRQLLSPLLPARSDRHPAPLADQPLHSLHIVVKPRPLPALPSPTPEPLDSPRPKPPPSLPPKPSPSLPPKPTALSLANPPAVVRSDAPTSCPRCQQPVYHAEQVLAIGKKWHKRCLRCAQCDKALDSSLAERAGQPFCSRCYADRFGTRAHGFLLRAGFATR